MSYTNAADVLPPELVKQIQSYVQGTQIYIPRPGDRRLGWGVKNGTRRMLEERNRSIRKEKRLGKSIDEIADLYNLSPDTVRKILYAKDQSARRIGA